MSMALLREIQDLKRRVEALERAVAQPPSLPAEIGQAILGRLAAQAAANRKAGAYADVRAVLERHPDLTPRQIVEQLPRKLSISRARELKKIIRTESAGSSAPC